MNYVRRHFFSTPYFTGVHHDDEVVRSVASLSFEPTELVSGAVRNAVGIRFGSFSGLLAMTPKFKHTFARQDGCRRALDGEFGEVLLRKAVVVHVARGDEAVIGGNRQPERHLVPARQTSRMACAALVPKISKTTPCKVAWRSLACAIPRRQFDTFTCNIPSSRNL